jgi:hypothetical protein
MPRKPPPVQWSLRDILLAVLVVALAMGWWVDRVKFREDAVLVKQLRAENAEVRHLLEAARAQVRSQEELDELLREVARARERQRQSPVRQHQ